MLQLAVSSDDAGLVNVLDAQSFARLLPLLGEQLNEAKVEQLFGAIDADDSGTIEFDEFVTLVVGTQKWIVEDDQAQLKTLQSGIGEKYRQRPYQQP